ncbi:transposase [Nocardiopsis sp. CNT-189]
MRPIPVYSSDRERHRLHRGGNRRLNSVLCTAALVRKRFHSGARELLARHEPAKGARGARRILQRRLIDVIHRAMLSDRASWGHRITQCHLAACHRSVDGLLRQYFPKGTGLSAHLAEELEAAAAELGPRPRRTLGWDTPAERLAGHGNRQRCCDDPWNSPRSPRALPRGAPVSRRGGRRRPGRRSPGRCRASTPGPGRPPCRR